MITAWSKLRIKEQFLTVSNSVTANGAESRSLLGREYNSPQRSKINDPRSTPLKTSVSKTLVGETSMSTVNEIHTAINSAIEAFNAQPELLKQIEDFKAEFQLLNEEVERLHKQVLALETTINDQSETIGRLRDANGQMQETLHVEIEARKSDEIVWNNTNNALLTENYSKSLRISELETTVRAKSTMVELLEADKASLTAQLDDRRTIVDKLTATLKSVMVDVSAIIPAPVQEVAASATFPTPSNPDNQHHESVTDMVGTRGLVETHNVVDEVTSEPKVEWPGIAEPIATIYRSNVA